MYPDYPDLSDFRRKQPNLEMALKHLKLSPILFCMGAVNWMVDEVKSNKCFIIPKKSVRINKFLQEACV